MGILKAIPAHVSAVNMLSYTDQRSDGDTESALDSDCGAPGFSYTDQRSDGDTESGKGV